MLNNRLFVVDTETSTNFDFVKKYNLSNDDCIVLFTSSNSKLMTLNDLESLYSSGVYLDFIKCDTSHYTNLDVYISMYITNFISNHFNKSLEIFIISEDDSYKDVIKFLQSLSLNNATVKVISSDSDFALEMASDASKLISEINSCSGINLNDMECKGMGVIEGYDAIASSKLMTLDDFDKCQSFINKILKSYNMLEINKLCHIDSRAPLSLSSLHIHLKYKFGEDFGPYVYNSIKKHYKHVTSLIEL